MFGSLTWVHISSSSPTRPIMRSTCLHGPIITQSIAHPGEVATGICSVAGRLTTLIHLERSCAKLQAQLTVKYDSVQLPEPPPGALPLDVAGGSVSKPPSSLPRTISGFAPELPSVAFCWHSCHEHDVRVSLSFSTHPIHLALSTKILRSFVEQWAAGFASAHGRLPLCLFLAPADFSCLKIFSKC